MGLGSTSSDNIFFFTHQKTKLQSTYAQPHSHSRVVGVIQRFSDPALKLEEKMFQNFGAFCPIKNHSVNFLFISCYNYILQANILAPGQIKKHLVIN